MGFNPRTHMGCDPQATKRYRDRSVSIHAPTWGATIAFLQGWQRLVVSIHAPTWGATLIHLSLSARARFQSTHPHGVRRGLPTLCSPPASFNPRTHMGCDCIFNKCLNITIQRYGFCEKKQNKNN